MTVSEKDRDILARTLWGEARGESLAGQGKRGQIFFLLRCAERFRRKDSLGSTSCRPEIRPFVSHFFARPGRAPDLLWQRSEGNSMSPA